MADIKIDIKYNKEPLIKLGQSEMDNSRTISINIITSAANQQTRLY